MNALDVGSVFLGRVNAVRAGVRDWQEISAWIDGLQSPRDALKGVAAQLLTGLPASEMPDLLQRELWEFSCDLRSSSSSHDDIEWMYLKEADGGGDAGTA